MIADGPRRGGASAIALITLTTDFSTTDSYVAEMKGVILTLCPAAQIIDLSHEVEPGNIRRGAFLLADAAPTFPPGTIHVAVVDPGVGSSRRRILIRSRYHQLPADERAAASWYIGPDNGLLTAAAPVESRDGVWSLTKLNQLPGGGKRSTFDGKHVFAPVAALLACGRAPGELGEPLTEIEELSFPTPYPEASGIRGEVVYIDRFGNAITNLPADLLASPHAAIVLEDGTVIERANAYADIGEGGAAVLENGAGRLEIGSDGSSAAELLGLREGSPLWLRSPADPVSDNTIR